MPMIHVIVGQNHDRKLKFVEKEFFKQSDII